MESFSCHEFVFVLVTKTNVASEHALNKNSSLKNISIDGDEILPDVLHLR